MTLEYINNLIQVFFNTLDMLSEEYEELTDTEVREALHLVLNYYFIWGKEEVPFPISFRMFSLEGNRAVAQTVSNFLDDVKKCSEFDNIPIGQSRLNLLQNQTIHTKVTSMTYL